MPYFSAVFAQTEEGWQGSEVDLFGVETPEDVADLIREVASEADVTLLIIEAEDEWFGLVRLNGADHPRVYLSDVRVALVDDLAAVLAEAADEELAETEAGPATRPAGHLDALEDLGISAEELVALTEDEGLLPADSVAVLAERLGFAEQLDRLR